MQQSCSHQLIVGYYHQLHVVTLTVNMLQICQTLLQFELLMINDNNISKRLFMSDNKNGPKRVLENRKASKNDHVNEEGLWTDHKLWSKPANQKNNITDCDQQNWINLMKHDNEDLQKSNTQQSINFKAYLFHPCQPDLSNDRGYNLPQNFRFASFSQGRFLH